MFSAARWRLTIVFTAVLVVILGISGFAVYFTTQSMLYDRVDAELADKAEQDVEMVYHERRNDPLSSGGSRPGDSDDTGFNFDPGGYFFAIVDENADIYEGTGGYEDEELASPEVLATALEDGSAIIETKSSDGETQRIYVLPATAPDGSQVFLQIGRSIERELDTLDQLQIILISVVAVSVVPALVGGYLLSGRALRPIRVAVESQRTFIADASHELKTPIAVVRTNAELLERHIASPKGASASDAEAVADILSEAERLGKMVDQMLTLAQADAGQVTRISEDVGLHEVAERVARSMKALATSRGVDLSTRISGPVEVRGDRERLRELLVILVDNAIKYSGPGGRVELSLRRRGRAVTITVTDTGQGIPPESLAHIFDRFYRVDKARSRDEGGTGLGLAIARHIVDTHDGTIGIESQPGKGTTVTVELKTRSRESQTESAAVAEQPPASGRQSSV